jgi:uncharacterized protein (DUF2147 family)
MVKLLLVGVFALASISPQNADAIVGIWKNSSGKGHIQIYKQQNKYYGKIIWLKDAVDPEGHPKTDRKNTDPAKRKNSLMGMVMLRDFKYSSGEWKGGHIYNPSDGKEYKGLIKLKDDKTIVVRGYMGISLIGKSDTWTRIK